MLPCVQSCLCFVGSEYPFVCLFAYVVVHLFLMVVLCNAQFGVLSVCLCIAFRCCLYFFHNGSLGK